MRWWENFGEYGFLTKLRSEQLRDIGPALSPAVRVPAAAGRRDAAAAPGRAPGERAAVAEWLEADPRVAYVNWAGLPTHPHHERAQHYLPLGPGAVFAFGLRATDEQDGRDAGAAFIENLQLACHLANVGDARTLVIHPASTTHQQLNAEQLAAGGRARRTWSGSASGSRTSRTSSGTSTRPSPPPPGRTRTEVESA